ncbi:hypothetical protein H6F51_21420 [Cyanobacteria bacterium FACHB-DQ100]|nr:hypothetical protein [Cyanobacteria bacterium FACHB-DQ100]
MLNQTTLERPQTTAKASTCAQCREYSNGLCQLRARADWGDAAYVKPTRTACHFADLLPF